MFSTKTPKHDTKENKSGYTVRLASQKLIHGIEKLCGLWGSFIAQHALAAVIICITLAIIFGTGLTKINVIYRPYDLWVPNDSEFVQATKWIRDNFPPQYRKHVSIWESENVLTASSIQKMYDFHSKVEQIVSPYNGRNYTWEDLCLPYPTYSDEKDDNGKFIKINVCYETSLLELWGFNETIIEELTDEEVIFAINNYTFSIPYDYSLRDFKSYLGGIERNESGMIVSAKATLYTWYTLIDFEALDKGDFEMDVATGEKVDRGGCNWERSLVQLMEKNNYINTSVTMRAGHTLSYVLTRSILEDAKWIGIGWSLLILYVLLTLGLPFQKDHRIIPVVVGLVAIAMAIFSSFGICSFLGIPYGTLNNVLPVLLVALGVDDMYVITTAWDAVKSPYKQNYIKRAQLTMERAGLAVTVTSVTNILAFVVGTQTRLPGLRWFCVYSATGVFLVYILQLTIFPTALVLNQKWYQSKGNKIITKTNKISKWQTCKILEGWGKVLSYKSVKILVIVITFMLFGFSSWNILHMSKEFDTLWLLPKRSPLYHWYNTINELFPEENKSGFVYFKGVDFPNDITALTNLASNISDCPYVSNVDAWFKDLDMDEEFPFISYLSEKNQCFVLIQNIDLKYLSHFKVNLRSDNLFGEDKPCSSFLLKFQYHKLKTEETRQAAMEAVRDIVRKSTVSGQKAAWAHVFSYWETEKIIITELLQSLALLMSVIGLISLILLASIRASVFVLACVIMTLIDVASFVHLWGLTINTITSITFVLAVGICVDYVVHIAHDFMKSHGTKHERCSQALHHIGSAVFHGGMSTLIAFILLSPSGSYIFVSYFKILTAVSICGLYHALVFLPVLLSLVGPESYPENGFDNYGFQSNTIFVGKLSQPDLRKSLSIYTINTGVKNNNKDVTYEIKNKQVSNIINHRRARSLPIYRSHLNSEVKLEIPSIEHNYLDSTKL